MIKTLALSAFAALALFLAPAAHAAPDIGKPAPEFTGTDTKGTAHKLSDFKGKTVVLEWTNPGCPFVQKHYDTKNMQTLQADATTKDVVWLTINSSADGEQGNMTPDEANKLIEEKGFKSTAYILDPSGEIGKLYGAKTTPHMYVIDKEGVLVYEGAIDDNDSSNPDDVKTAKNYVTAALNDLEAGKPVETSKTKAYGCSVKYKD